ncbi:universal stress protein [Aurantimonas sp. E1-2-R+4]|uniref:universal stress protein n=1 Tax=Aurantimonas sp. E1-2-R+4 TaxID=3113714 RepID=UPI003FA544EC
MNSILHDRLNTALLTVAFLGLVGGLGLTFADLPQLADTIWAAGVLPVLAALVVEIVRSLRQGEVGLDIVAALSMSAALLFGETLAAAVVALMYSGGTFLESFAEGRARREMSDLLSRVPRTATRHRNGTLDDVPLDDVEPGDLLLIRHRVKARAEVRAQREASVADELILIAEQNGADLIVGGGYGHARLREWVFGGVTHDLLRRCPICCLLSH